jgi:hypothetical protein
MLAFVAQNRYYAIKNNNLLHHVRILNTLDNKDF